eukprot:5476807-Amphidinium_carterae.1
MSSVIDVQDDGDVPAATPQLVAGWFANYAELKGGPPMEDFEPSPEQVSALHCRVVEQHLEPYADFSLLTPYGRRVAKTLRLRSWVPQGDGTYRPADIPGPPNFGAWSNCFKVYSAA